MNEQSMSVKRVYQGRIFDLEVHQVELATGARSVREVIRHPGAVALVARRPDGRFVFIRQYRKAVEEIILEIVAGTLEPGEDVEACARRELAEESGYAAESLVRLGAIYPSPGYMSEVIHIFYAETGAEPRGRDLDVDEHIETLSLSREEFEEEVRQGRVRDAKTLSAWLLYQQWAMANAHDGAAK